MSDFLPAVHSCRIEADLPWYIVHLIWTEAGVSPLELDAFHLEPDFPNPADPD